MRLFNAPPFYLGYGFTNGLLLAQSDQQLIINNIPPIHSVACSLIESILSLCPIGIAYICAEEKKDRLRISWQCWISSWLNRR